MQPSLDDTDLNVRDFCDLVQRKFLEREQDNCLALQHGELRYRIRDPSRAFGRDNIAQDVERRRTIRHLFRFAFGASEVAQRQIADNAKQIGAQASSSAIKAAPQTSARKHSCTMSSAADWDPVRRHAN